MHKKRMYVHNDKKTKQSSLLTNLNIEYITDKEISTGSDTSITPTMIMELHCTFKYKRYSTTDK